MLSKLIKIPAPRLLVGMTCAMAPLIFVTNAFAGNSIWGAPLMAVVFAGMSLWALSKARSSNIILGLALIGQAAAFTASLSGHSWQSDSHMAFFAFLACLVSVRDVRTMVVATAAIALHHLSLALFFPALIYPSTDLLMNLERTVLHAVIVLIEATALITTIVGINRLLAENLSQIADVQAATTSSEKARTDALAALATAELNDKAAQEAQKAAEEALSTSERQRAKVAQAEQRARELDQEREEEARQQSEELRMVVRSLGQGLEALAHKNVSLQIDTVFPAEYEDLRADFNTTAQALNFALGKMSCQSSQMQTEAHNIVNKISGASKTAAGQAARAEQASNHMQSVAQDARETATDASSTSNAVQQVKSNTETSAEVVGRASAAMSEIDKSANEISAIIGVIEQIAFQTNLLALNAGVEAARAGDAGRGFAVVASEVRALAQRSSDAARDINGLIGDSQNHVKLGVKHVSDTVESLQSVRAGVEDISARIESIAGRSLSQADTISSISNTILTVEKESKESAGTMDEMAKATNRLTASANDLMAQAAEFVTRENEQPAADFRRRA
ncbi:Methyl-accepting chemotaxis protein McpA [Sulfitobacter noctilucicola]|uniref:Methyl-accepting chemotaxis protein n=1 Tax=Sulfitobacter noctilucicola TaxID=1342301 RepID=A0A7W6M784_9RHOB|nr:methyl-accepting chemotaxis protein [Sulfitobacter noctilucicola]KIN65130.1 Methyl-accepting chemotaxis protein McpA [Sulfitobacter noctilucicola]MBB4173734.1 methyl-accepting chemotaxis protein [Sulfitobacter noctilucicola]